MATNPVPAPAAPLQQKTQTAFLTLSLITQSCHGVVNTVFTAPNPKPDWFDALNANLDTAKATATNWIDNLAPEVTGGVPVQVIDYGTTYSAIVAKIDSIALQYPAAQGAGDPHVTEVRELVAALQTQVTQIIGKCDATDKALKTWGDQMQVSHDALSGGAASIQKAETSLSADISKMNEAITTLNNTIHQENIAIAASAGAIGLGLILTVVGIALAPETGGASLLVAGTGALLVVGGAVTWGIMQHKINEQFDEVAKDQSELQDDNRQMVALQGLASASSTAVQYITSATSALSDFRTSWAVFEGELQGVATKLADAESALSVIVADAFTDASAAEWADATAFAQSLSNAPTQVAVKAMPMSTSQAA